MLLELEWVYNIHPRTFSMFCDLSEFGLTSIYLASLPSKKKMTRHGEIK